MNNNLIHSVRHANGAWDGYGTLWLSSGPYDTVGQPYSATVNGEEHVEHLGVTGHQPPVAHVYHHIRHADGTWNVSMEANTFPVYAPFAMTAVLGQLQMVATNGTALQHALRQADGTWTSWQPVPVQGTFTQYATAGALGDLRLVAVNADGKGLTYTVRHSDGTWSPQRQVAFTTDHGATAATKVSVAEVGDDLQVIVLGNHGDVYHSILHPSGQWDGFGYIGTVAGEVGTVTAIAAAASQGRLQVAVANSAGGLYHTIRFANGSWQRFGDIKHEIGNPGPVDELTLAGD